MSVSLSSVLGLCLRIKHDLYGRGDPSSESIFLSHLRKHNLKYLGLTGNVSHTKDVDMAIRTILAIVISEDCKMYILFGFTIYLMHLADYLKRKKSKKKKES